jgi:toxin ParE1/3/4
MPKAVIPREPAKQDTDEAIDFYLSENTPEAALGFIEELERAYGHIGRHPSAGSSRYDHELNLPGLRFWPLRKYLHLIFYVERVDHVDVWRMLHGQRDIPAWMREPPASV